MIIAANWKMNPLPADAAALFASYCADQRLTTAAARILCFVPSCYLFAAERAFEKTAIQWGAQNSHPERAGAYTGEISADMVSGFGGKWVLAGHSERRGGLGETDDFVAAKLVAALTAGLSVVLCVGEPQDMRERGAHNEYVENQLLASLAAFCAESDDWQAQHLPRLVIAYEPVWAIGTGLVATKTQIDEMHTHIHEILIRQFSSHGQHGMPPILYGGSVNKDNAETILSLPLVGGALVGGASLSADSFAAIVASADATI